MIRHAGAVRTGRNSAPISEVLNAILVVPLLIAGGSVRAETLEVLLRGTGPTEAAPHGEGNIYAPAVRQAAGRWWMWYGGQGDDGHDRIHLARSADGTVWEREGVVLDRGSANHVNDPTVVLVDGRWWMFYTVAESGEADEIAAAWSHDGVAWHPQGVVLGRGAEPRWDSSKVGRPAVLHEAGVFRMWYDGQPTPQAAASDAVAARVARDHRAVGYAESRDGLHWERWPEPVHGEGAGAVDVARCGDRLVMVSESHRGVQWADSDDGTTWRSRGLLVPVSGGEVDRFGHVTPCLIPAAAADGAAWLLVGAAARRTWDGNAIARIVLPPPAARDAPAAACQPPAR
jgi:hypothetical protein